MEAGRTWDRAHQNPVSSFAALRSFKDPQHTFSHGRSRSGGGWGSAGLVRRLVLGVFGVVPLLCSPIFANTTVQPLDWDFYLICRLKQDPQRPVYRSVGLTPLFAVVAIQEKWNAMLMLILAGKPLHIPGHPALTSSRQSHR